VTVSDALDTRAGSARSACRPDLTVCRRLNVFDRT